MRKQNISVLFCMVLVLIYLGSNPAYAKKPPWAGHPGGPHNPPPSAPEPLSMVLIGMGATGAAGYYLGRRKKK
jgi:hypothetical protein